jgi:hypothetical protein
MKMLLLCPLMTFTQVDFVYFLTHTELKNSNIKLNKIVNSSYIYLYEIKRYIVVLKYFFVLKKVESK